MGDVSKTFFAKPNKGAVSEAERSESYVAFTKSILLDLVDDRGKVRKIEIIPHKEHATIKEVYRERKKNENRQLLYKHGTQYGGLMEVVFYHNTGKAFIFFSGNGFNIRFDLNLARAGELIDCFTQLYTLLASFTPPE